jgi:hypothetical protein
MSRRPILQQNQMLQEFAKYHGKPNPTRRKRALIRKSNPFHYTFGNIRPVWKTWENYATNMELIHGGMYEQD